jgi:hypothetical protein
MYLHILSGIIQCQTDQRSLPVVCASWRHSEHFGHDAECSIAGATCRLRENGDIDEDALVRFEVDRCLFSSNASGREWAMVYRPQTVDASHVLHHPQGHL